MSRILDAFRPSTWSWGSRPQALSAPVRRHFLEDYGSYAEVVNRGSRDDRPLTDIPISGLSNWTMSSISAATVAHVNGSFEPGARLTESMIGDDRVQQALSGRAKGITSREPRQVPSPLDRDGIVAREVEELWPDVVTEEVVEQAVQWQVMQGFALFRVDWSYRAGRWVPSLYPWNPQHVYFDQSVRQYVAITQEGPVWIDPVRDERWLLLTPHGYYRGWIRGAIRSCSTAWAVRSLALRDWARFCEVHGLPVRLVKVPASGDAKAKQRFFQAIRNLGAESTVLLPQQGGSDGKDWAAELLEAKDTSWKAFPGIIEQCNSSITLAIRGTNLTSEVGEKGSYAATKVHREEDSDYAESDCRKLCQALRDRLWWWYALRNHHSGELAPRTVLDPPDSQGMKEYGEGMKYLADGVVAMKGAGVSVDVLALCKRWDVPVLKGEPVDPALPAPPDEDVTGGVEDYEEAADDVEEDEGP